MCVFLHRVVNKEGLDVDLQIRAGLGELVGGEDGGVDDADDSDFLRVEHDGGLEAWEEGGIRALDKTVGEADGGGRGDCGCGRRGGGSRGGSVCVSGPRDAKDGHDAVEEAVDDLESS